MRKFALLAVLAIAATAMMATSAMAATQVRDAATGQLCSNVSPAINKASPPVLYQNTGTPYHGAQPSPYVSGGCTVRLTQFTPLTVQRAGFPVTQCKVAYDLHLGPDGWGYANNFVWEIGGQCQGWTTPGSRIVMPVEVAPKFNGQTAYTAVDAATDLNMEMWAKDPAGTSHRGFLSLDVYVPTVGQPYYGASLIVKNQQLSGYAPFGHGFRGGAWTRSSVAGNGNVTITH